MTAQTEVLKHRWAQLDLARQMESLAFIRQFMELMAQAGYTGILLYLEDRIRTASYPWPKDGTCYTPEEIRSLVEYGQKLGLELVPCVATLGHAERFLAHPELVELSELQGDMGGRFGWGKKQTFCPTHPKFYPFLLTYLKEVAELFPSPFFHAGLDEFWDFCLCPRCREKAPDFAAQEALFVQHVETVRQGLEACGKTMMMWSDMFEYYPRAQEKISRKVVLVDWQYQEDVRRYVHHLFDVFSEDRQALNQKLGFVNFVAPADMTYRNGESLLASVRGKGASGFIQTSWEKKDIYLYHSLPIFVYNGLLASGMAPETATRTMMQKVFGTEDPLLTQGVTLALTLGGGRHFQRFSRTRLLTRDFRGLPLKLWEGYEAASLLLRERQGEVTTGMGSLVLTDLLDTLEEERLAARLAKEIHHAVDGHPLDQAGYQEALDGLRALLDRRCARWQTWRPSVEGEDALRKQCRKVLEEVAAIPAELASGHMVRLRICAPDGYTVENLAVSLQYEKEGPWHTLFRGGVKPEDLNHALAEFFLPYRPPCQGKPRAVKVEAAGMGGEGICHVQVDGRAPVAILGVQGWVQNPEHLLVDNVNFAWMGSQSTQEAYFHAPLAEMVNAVTLLLEE